MNVEAGGNLLNKDGKFLEKCGMLIERVRGINRDHEDGLLTTILVAWESINALEGDH